MQGADIAECVNILPLKTPITTAADDIFKYIFFFSKQISLDISCESPINQTIHRNVKTYFL